jgi:predicted GNAT family N-acyltransferase
MIKIEVGDWNALRARLEPVRRSVFIEEQNVPEDLEWDEFDDVSLHALAWLDDQAVGVARLLPDGHIGRMAVLAGFRRRGVGAALLQALMDQARVRGIASVRLHAQCHAQTFYQRAGFVAEGEVFMEAGIPHVAMTCGLG